MSDPSTVTLETVVPRGSAAAALRVRDYRNVTAGQAISITGTWMQWIAQGWLILELTGDPLALGIVAAAQILPVQLLAMFGGLIGDVLPRRATLVLTQSLSALQALALFLLVILGVAEAWHVYLLAFLLGLVLAVDHPVRDAFVAELVPRAALRNAVGIDRAAYYGGRVIGPAAAGLLIATAGTASVFLVNAISFLPALAGLLSVRRAPRERAVGEDAASRAALRRPLPALREGLGFVRRTPEISMTLVVIWLIGTFGINFSNLLPLLVRDTLGEGAESYGLLMTGSGIGSMIGAVTAAIWPASFRGLLVASAAVGVAGITVAFSRWFPLTMVAMMVAGWTLMTMATAASTLIQVRVPDALRARVMALYTIAFIGPSPIGSLVSGALGVAFGVVAALAFGGLVALATALGAAVALRTSYVQHVDIHKFRA